jgi:hypothetical protein
VEDKDGCRRMVDGLLCVCMEEGRKERILKNFGSGERASEKSCMASAHTHTHTHTHTQLSFELRLSRRVDRNVFVCVCVCV